jgi:hypothetical protein
MVPSTRPGGNPVTEVPGLRPRSASTVVEAALERHRRFGHSERRDRNAGFAGQSGGVGLACLGREVRAGQVHQLGPRTGVQTTNSPVCRMLRRLSLDPTEVKQITGGSADATATYEWG